ncbi:MAG: hypothetical protein ACR2PL_25600, partial [Dehalococcoidia bacterium]
IYAAIGVREYYLYDPLRDWVRGGFQGYRLGAGGYEAIAADAEGGLVSRALGVRLLLEGGQVQCYDLETGERLLTGEERAEAEEERADDEAEARRAAELQASQATEARDAAELQASQAAEARDAAELRATQAAEAQRVAEALLLELQQRLEQLEGRSPGEPPEG